MHVSRLEVVAVGAVVDDWRGGEPAATVRQPPRLVRDSNRDGVRLGSIRTKTPVAIVTADMFVEVQELRGADGTVVQGPQPVLHPDVVEGPASEAGHRVSPEDIGVVFVYVAARSGRHCSCCRIHWLAETRAAPPLRSSEWC